MQISRGEVTITLSHQELHDAHDEYMQRHILQKIDRDFPDADFAQKETIADDIRLFFDAKNDNEIHDLAKLELENFE